MYDQLTCLKITINDSTYPIETIEGFNTIKKNIFENIVSKKNMNDKYQTNNYTTKYTVSFYNNNLKELEIYLYNREYIVDLIEDININNLNLSFNNINLR
jgi:hypothetical protein